MQVTETLSQGLKREYNVVVSAGDLGLASSTRSSPTSRTRCKINGFRPGKVPVAHLKRVYGRSVMADVVQETINAANKQIVDDNGLRLAMEPKIELPTEQDAIEAALEARGDLNFKVALEVLPKFEVGEFSDISLERPVADVEESEVDTALQRLADNRRTYADRPEGEKAETARPRDGRFRRHDQRRALRGRHGRGHRGGARLEHFHPRLRGGAARRGRRRTTRRSRRLSRRTTPFARSPARRPIST